MNPAIFYNTHDETDYDSLLFPSISVRNQSKNTVYAKDMVTRVDESVIKEIAEYLPKFQNNTILSFAYYSYNTKEKNAPCTRGQDVFHKKWIHTKDKEEAVYLLL